MGIMGAVNPVAGASLLRGALAEPRMEQGAITEYQRQLPAVQRAADVQAYQDYLKGETAQAGLIKANAADVRALQTQQLMMAGDKAKALTELMNDAAKGTMTPDVLRQRGLLIAQANPLLGITAQDIQDVIDKTPPVGPKYKLVWTGPQGLIPHVQDRAGNEYDMKTAPDQDARALLQSGQDQIDSALKKQLDQKQAEAMLPYGPAVTAAKAAQAGAEASARTAAELKTGQQMVGTPETQAIAQAIIDGRMAAPSSFALKTPYWQAVMGQVMQLDPNWSEQRAQLRKDFTVGKHSSEINAINTAMAHVGMMGDAIGALNNGNTQALNSLANTLGIAAGKDNVTTFKAIVNRVGPEISKAYVGSGGSAGERGTTEADFDPKMSPQQLQSNVAITARLLRSKVAALQNQWNQNAPAGQDFQSRFIMPQAKQELDKWAPEGADGGAGAGGGRGVLDVGKLKQNNPGASPAQIQDAIARAKSAGMQVINQ